MDNYIMFVGFCMFVIGLIVGRVTMAIQYEVMKGMSRENKASKDKSRKHLKRPKKAAKPSRLEYKLQDDSYKKDFYDFMKKKN
ncbi:hypothetical protein GF345_06815 [Candidatus Woesearchaeota archaeon]|nr:hypothetical protein [Candidatus Woesearchaeota archaeon]